MVVITQVLLKGFVENTSCLQGKLCRSVEWILWYSLCFWDLWLWFGFAWF